MTPEQWRVSVAERPRGLEKLANALPCRRDPSSRAECQAVQEEGQVGLPGQHINGELTLSTSYPVRV
jgi:hypothetical protein